MAVRGAVVLVAGVAGHAAVVAAPMTVLPGGIRTLLSPPAALVLVLLSVWVIGEALAQPGGLRGARRRGRPELLPLAILIVVWVSLAEAWARGSAGAVIAGAGIALAGGGVGLRVWAIRTLGARFLDEVDLLPGHRLAREGPYRWLHHPSEIGNVLIAAGCALALGSLAGLAVALGVVAPLALHRMRREDALLAPLRRKVSHEPAGAMG